MDAVWHWLSSLGVVAWVMLMIIAVTICQTIVTLTRMSMKHKERMAMIQRGINPGPVHEAYNAKADEG